MANYKDIKYNFSTSSNASGLGGAWILIKTQTVSSSVAAVDFIHGTSDVVLDNTYESYLIKWCNVHPANQKPEFLFHPGDGDFTDTKLSVQWITRMTYGNGNVTVGVDDTNDLAQATGGQPVCVNVGNGNATDSCSGNIYMHGCGETDQWKTYIYDTITVTPDEMEGCHGGGNIQQTGAIDRFRMDFSAGNIDAGSFSLYGLSDA
jgi:hypothetical protein|tara:strand:+ start:175 stop:789 length:615 start_codon:yes stop_codon:yes gene_type:complete